LPRFHYRSVSEAAILHLIGWSEIWGALQAAIAAMQIDSYTQCFIDGDLALPANGSL
jgi:hypothetical protein